MKPIKIFLILLGGLFSQWTLKAQCDTYGQVVMEEGCGLLVQMADGTVLEPVNAADFQLVESQIIRFAYSPATILSTCMGGTLIELDCVETQYTEECSANFEYALSPNPNPVITFSPNMEDIEGVSFFWDFGDGNTSTEILPTHAYEDDGVYQVCLTVTGVDCEETHCEEVPYVGGEGGDPNTNCNFAIDYAVEGLTVTATIYSMVDYGPYQPQEVSWFNTGTGALISREPDIVYTFPADSTGNLCVEFVAYYDNNSVCEGSICETIELELACVDENLIDTDVLCGGDYTPVCGCDGVTYQNVCQAENWYGVTSWTEGECPDCEAAFEYTLLNDSTVQVVNTSTGPFLYFEWTINGGQAILGQDTLIYSTSSSSADDICITIWNDADCDAFYCETIIIGDGDCANDCVYPGDTNKDGLSNFQDLLQIGLGYGTTGTPRNEENNSLEFEPTPAVDWGTTTLDGVDYKHLDCNGDGTINEDDIPIIAFNYTPDETTTPNIYSEQPDLRVEFSTNHITIDNDTPSEIYITAQIQLGASGQPLFDLYGLSFRVSFPGELVVPHTTSIDYNDNSFFGTINEVMSVHHEFIAFGDGQFDAAYSRKNGQSKNGYGTLAALGFIISSDIIGGRTEPEVDFPVALSDVVVVDEEGNNINVTISEDPAVVTLINSLVTDTDKYNLDKKVEIYPNPVADVLLLRLKDVMGEKVTVFNAYGQIVAERWIEEQELIFEVEDWGAGVYLVRVETERGTVSKKLVVE